MIEYQDKEESAGLFRGFSYINWMRDNMNLDDDMKYSLDKALGRV